MCEASVSAAAGVTASWADPHGRALSLRAEMVLGLVLIPEPFWAISSDRTNSDDARAYKQQGHFPSGEECQSMSTLVLGRLSFFWGQEVECLMVSSFCSSSGVPIQFQPLWALFCFKLIFCLLFD